MSEIFTNDDYLKILQNRFETSKIEFLKAERESFSDDMEGFMGEHFVLNITYKLNNNISKESFFVKTLPRKSEYQMKMCEEFNSFGKEIFIYWVLFEEFRKYGYDISFAPRCYYCKNQETLVMENMIVNGYETYEKLKIFDVEHCKQALKALAQYHGNSLALEETKSKELGRVFRMNETNPEAFSEIFFIEGDIDSPTTKFVEMTKKCFKALSQFVPESEEWKRELFEKIDNFDSQKVFYQELKSRKTCCHGDLWSNNMLFKYEQGVPTKCRLVDFQLVRHHHPGFDVMLVIHTNTNREFRKRHFDELVTYYYECLCGVLDEYGWDGRVVMPEDDFIAAARALEPVALLQAVSNRSWICLPKDIKNNLNEDESEVTFQDLVERDRSELVVECCHKDEVIKKKFIDDVYDLYEYL